MSHESLETMDVGLAADLKAAFRRNGWTPEEVKRACAGDFLGRVRSVLLGHTEIKEVEYLIDLDADPFVPEGWTAVEHQKDGTWKWNPTELKLYLSPKQQGNKWIRGEDLHQEFKGQRVLNANVLDYLLKNSHLIPEDWKGKYIFFWGTIYRAPSGVRCVRCLYWDGLRWNWMAVRPRSPQVVALRPCPFGSCL